MLSINTNLSSLITQHSMKSATKLLNQAVERMTTGYKINHAKDNAANYSISQKMNMQISSFDVAADNVAMGMDLVTTASDIISNMQDKASRLQALCIQARNGTYGAQSIEAINSEAGAIMAEINRLYNTAEYNNVRLFNNKPYELRPEHKTLCTDVKAKKEYNGFIADPKTYTDEEVAAMTALTDDITTVSSSQKYSISNVDELVRLAELVNSGIDTTDVVFVLGADIDLSSISNWIPIGDFTTNSEYQFKGIFDGNGHIIKNLTINNHNADRQGLFGFIAYGSTVKNVGIKNASISGKQYVGILSGCAYTATITNCFASGTVEGSLRVGGFIGYTYSYSSLGTDISNSYSTSNVLGENETGGFIGRAYQSDISNCFSTSYTSGADWVGGFVGCSYTSKINNSFSTGSVNGNNRVGGLIGYAYSSSNVRNCYADSNITGNEEVGGFVGMLTSSYVNNNYTTSIINGKNYVGGFIGRIYNTTGSVSYDSNYTYGTVSSSNKSSLGSFVGGITNTANGTSFATINITNSQCMIQDGIEVIGGCFKTNSTEVIYDMTTMLAGISAVEFKNISTILQVGINSTASNQITFDTNFDLKLGSLWDLTSDSTLASITEFQKLLSEKATALGAVENRLQSALESIEVNIENLTSSLSTIRDADIAEVSSEYIRQQILQQASATLMATANQSPSIALQLI